MYVPPIQAFWQYSDTFFGLKWTPVDKVKQNPGFNIPFHLYIHISWPKVSRVHTYLRVWHVCTPNTGILLYIWQYSFTFFGLKWTPVDKLTQNLGFNIHFNSTFMIMTKGEQDVHLLEGRTCTYSQYRHFATYDGIRIPSLVSNWHQLTN